MDSSLLKPLVWQLRRWHRRQGWPLWVGAALLCTTFGVLTATMQMRTQVRLLRAEAPAQVQTVLPPRPIETGSADSLAKFYASLPPEAERFVLVKRLLLLADDNDVLPPAADYRLVAEPMTRLVRYQIGLPVAGDWRSVQAYVMQALNQMRFLTLDSLLLQREGADSPIVEGKLQFSVLMLRSAARDETPRNLESEGRQDGERN